MLEQDQRGGDDVAEPPGAAAVAAQRLEGGLEQGVGAFAEAAQRSVDGVVGLLVGGDVKTQFDDVVLVKSVAGYNPAVRFFRIECGNQILSEVDRPLCRRTARNPDQLFRE
jgi:hypothetical protein